MNYFLILTFFFGTILSSNTQIITGNLSLLSSTLSGATAHGLRIESASAFVGSNIVRAVGYSVRCIKD